MKAAGNSEPNMKAKRRLLITGIVIGSLLTLSPLIGLLGTIFGMNRAFKTLGSSGVADPHALAAEISTVLYSTAAGLFLLPLGIIILSLSLVFFFRQRASTPPPFPQRPTP